uniref:BTB_2 domain-containing protein n=1 Tax=Macrostomum lignano TaxID=282301 RepID=A0A1I8F8E7_9PLAT
LPKRKGETAHLSGRRSEQECISDLQRCVSKLTSAACAARPREASDTDEQVSRAGRGRPKRTRHAAARKRHRRKYRLSSRSSAAGGGGSSGNASQTAAQEAAINCGSSSSGGGGSGRGGSVAKSVDNGRRKKGRPPKKRPKLEPADPQAGDFRRVAGVAAASSVAASNPAASAASAATSAASIAAQLRHRRRFRRLSRFQKAGPAAAQKTTLVEAGQPDAAARDNIGGCRRSLQLLMKLPTRARCHCDSGNRNGRRRLPRHLKASLCTRDSIDSVIENVLSQRSRSGLYRLVTSSAAVATAALLLRSRRRRRRRRATAGATDFAANRRAFRGSGGFPAAMAAAPASPPRPGGGCGGGGCSCGSCILRVDAATFFRSRLNAQFPQQAARQQHQKPAGPPPPQSMWVPQKTPCYGAPPMQMPSYPGLSHPPIPLGGGPQRLGGVSGGVSSGGGGGGAPSRRCPSCSHRQPPWWPVIIAKSMGAPTPSLSHSAITSLQRQRTAGLFSASIDCGSRGSGGQLRPPTSLAPPPCLPPSHPGLFLPQLNLYHGDGGSLFAESDEDGQLDWLLIIGWSAADCRIGIGAQRNSAGGKPSQKQCPDAPVMRKSLKLSQQSTVGWQPAMVSRATSVTLRQGQRLAASRGRRPPETRIIINVGGVRFETYKSTLQNIPDTRLAWLAEATSVNSAETSIPDTGEYFFDAGNSGVFRHDSSTTTAPAGCTPPWTSAAPSPTGASDEEELAYWGMTTRNRWSPAAGPPYRTHRDAQETLAELNGGELSDDGEEDAPARHRHRRFGIEEAAGPELGRWQRVRPRVWCAGSRSRYSALGGPGKTQKGPADQWFLTSSHTRWRTVSVLFILASIIALVVETLARGFESRARRAAAMNCSRLMVSDCLRYTQPRPAVHAVDITVTAYFALELAARLVFCPRNFSNRAKLDRPGCCGNGLASSFAVAAGNQPSSCTPDSQGARILRIFKLTQALLRVENPGLVHRELTLLGTVFANLRHPVRHPPHLHLRTVRRESPVNEFRTIPIGFSGYIVGGCLRHQAASWSSALPVPIIVKQTSPCTTRNAQARLKLPKRKKRVLVGAHDALKQTAGAVIVGCGGGERPTAVCISGGGRPNVRLEHQLSCSDSGEENALGERRARPVARGRHKRDSPDRLPRLHADITIEVSDDWRPLQGSRRRWKSLRLRAASVYMYIRIHMHFVLLNLSFTIVSRSLEFARNSVKSGELFKHQKLGIRARSGSSGGKVGGFSGGAVFGGASRRLIATIRRAPPSTTDSGGRKRRRTSSPRWYRTASAPSEAKLSPFEVEEAAQRGSSEDSLKVPPQAPRMSCCDAGARWC